MFINVEYYVRKEATTTALINVAQITSIEDLGYVDAGFRDEDSALLSMRGGLEFHLTGGCSMLIKERLPEKNFVPRKK